VCVLDPSRRADYSQPGPVPIWPIVPVTREPSTLLLMTAVIVGAASWWAVANMSGRREAWDSELYFLVALPALGLLTGVLGVVAPERPWRWAFAPFGGQALAAFVQNPTANLLPIGLIVFAFFGALCLPAAYAGAFVGRRVHARRLR
jgi:peptidoglycan/LPS O-acetylase OafA/YrhL